MAFGKKNKHGFLTKVLMFINALFALLLLLSYLSPLIKPTSFWPMVFMGMAYPIFLWINVIFILFWLVFSWRLSLMSVLVIILGYSHLFNYISFGNPNKAIDPELDYLKVLSYNVRNFDFFSSPSVSKPNFENRNNIFDFLQKEDFDIICFQEYFQDNSGRFKTTDSLTKLLRAKNIHFEYSKSRNRRLFFGVATYSAYPILHKGRIDYPTQAGNIGIFTDILFNKDTIRIYNLHLESIGLSKEDLLLFDNAIKSDHNIEDIDFSVGIKRITRRIRNAAINRTVQAKLISEHIANCPYPIILAGDFNDTPFSYAYRQVSKNLNDAFKSGRRIGGNTHIWKYPSFRIDFLLYSDHFYGLNFKTGKQKYSDHYPISAIFALRNNN